MQSGSQASSIKLKQLITNRGELNCVHKRKKTSTPNNLSIILMANGTMIKGFDKAVETRFVVHLLRYTTRQLDADEVDCFHHLEIDYDLDELLNNEVSYTLMVNLLIRWAPISMLEKTIIDIST